MTYRKLIEICYKTPEEDCYDDKCPFQKECKVFRDTVGEYPNFLYKALNIDFDAEIVNDEIIRCKDCRFYDGYCYLHSRLSYSDYLNNKVFHCYVGENDYCSRAKRKGDEK